MNLLYQALQPVGAIHLGLVKQAGLVDQLGRQRISLINPIVRPYTEAIKVPYLAFAASPAVPLGQVINSAAASQAVCSLEQREGRACAS